MTADGRTVDALIFDTMGTVVDVDGSIRDRLAVVLARHGSTGADRAAQQWDRRMGAEMERINDGRAEWRSHQALRRRALETLIEEHELPALTTAERDDLTAVIRTLRPWPDSSAALAALGAVASTVALSNADLAELVALSRNADLRWHGVLSAEFARAYKPHRSVYRSALRLLQLDPARTMMVAAHPWDLRAAAELGMRTAYIARPGAERPSIDDRFTLVADDLADLHAQLVAAH